MPCAVGGQGADVVVYVADRDGVLDFVVKNCLEGGYDLGGVSACLISSV